MSASEPLLTARGLRIGQGDKVLIDDVNLDIRPGEIFGVVGRARSGKTALLETLVGLRPPLAGSVTLFGNPNPAAISVRRHVGSSLRPSAVERCTTVTEALEFCASLYNCKADVEGLLREVGLTEARATYREKLTPPEMARLSLAMGLVSNPRVLVADEPTRELDPAGRQQAWTILRARRDAGVAVILSTTSTEEAERLCDRVALLGNGRVLACDTPAGVVAAGGAPGRMTIETVTPMPGDALRGLPGITDVEIDGTLARLLISDPTSALFVIGRAIRDGQWNVRGLRLSQATLEDRFVELMRAASGTAGRAS